MSNSLRELEWKIHLLWEETQEIRAKLNEHRYQYPASMWDIKYLADLQQEIWDLEKVSKKYLEEKIRLIDKKCR